MKFNPSKSLQVAFEPEMIRLYVASRSSTTMKPALMAVGDMWTYLHAAFIGVPRRVEILLPRSLELLTTAIHEREPFGFDPNNHWQELHWSRAVARWFKSNDAAVDDWREAAKLEQALWVFEGRPWGRGEILRYGVEDCVVLSCLAGEYEQAISVHEQWVGKTELKGLLRTKVPRSFGYLVALVKTGRASVDEAKLHEVGRRVLKGKLTEPWLGGGQFLRAVAWMKLVHGFGPYKDDPAELQVLRAYEDMPDVEMPHTVRDLLATSTR